MNNTDKHTIEITDEEHARIKETLHTMVKEEADQCYGFSWGSLGALENTEINGLLDRSVRMVIHYRDCLLEAMEEAREDDKHIPKTISVNKKQYMAILKERKVREAKEAEEAKTNEEYLPSEEERKQYADALATYLNENGLPQPRKTKASNN